MRADICGLNEVEKREKITIAILCVMCYNTDAKRRKVPVAAAFEPQSPRDADSGKGFKINLKSIIRGCSSMVEFQLGRLIEIPDILEEIGIFTLFFTLCRRI
jgi:hypothetical protein